MASVYTNDLRLEEIGSGEQSGSWGDTTNTNLELIAEAFAFGTEAITTNADTHTTTIADGATDPGRALFLKYTGTLDSACTITLGPNTVSKMWFIQNSTSGSQNIIISQGSGANVTIPAGQTKSVYSNGAGSGAAIVDAFATLNVVDLLVDDDLTVTDDATVGGTLGVTGVLTTTAATVFNGGFAANDGSTITTNDNSDNLTLTSTDADASAGPNLNLYRNSASPADSDFLGNIKFNGRNDNSQDVQYAEIEVYAMDVSDGAEDALYNLNVMTSGTNTSYMQVRGETGQIVFNESGLDLDFRVESNDNANMLSIDGALNQVAIGTSDFSNDSVKSLLTIGSSNHAIHVLGVGAAGDGGGFFTSAQKDDKSTGWVTIGSWDDGTNRQVYYGGGSWGPEEATLHRFYAGSYDAGSGGAPERMRIDSSGRVGINLTPSASAPLTNVSAGILQVNGNMELRFAGSNSDPAGARYFNIVNTDTTLVADQPLGGLQWIGLDSSNPNSNMASITSYCAGNTGTTSDIRFKIAASEAVRITSEGRVGINNTNPDYLLSVFTSAMVQAAEFGRNTDGTQRTIISFRSNSGSSNVGSISINNSATAFNTSSDYRLKTDAQPMTGASDRVLALKPVNFEWIADGTRVDGFLAHEAQAVVPECVTGTKDAMMDEKYEVSAATGDIYTPATNAYVDEDGNDVDAVDEVIHSADVEQPETLEDDQQWRETTAAVMGTRSVPDMQGIDQSKMVPLLVAALQEALARITALENA